MLRVSEVSDHVTVMLLSSLTSLLECMSVKRSNDAVTGEAVIGGYLTEKRMLRNQCKERG